MELRGRDRQLRELVVADLDAGFVGMRVQRGADGEAGLRGRAGDQVHDDFVAGQRTTAPVLGDEAKQTMFDLVPLAGPRRKMAHPQPQARGVGQRLQRLLPQPVAAAVAPAAIRRDQQLSRLREAVRPHLAPPAADAGRREFGRVVVDAHTDPALVAGQVVDAVGDRLALFLVRKIVHLDFFRLALRLPFLAGVLEFPDQFLLFGVHRDDGLPPPVEAAHRLVDVLELGIAVGVRGAFARLAVGLQAVPRLLQQGGHGAVGDRMVLPGQFLRQLGGAFARPAQGRFTMAARQGSDQAFQGPQQSGIRVRERFATGALPPQGQGNGFLRPLATLLQFAHSRQDGVACDAGGAGDGGDATPPQGLGFGRRPLTTHAFVHHGCQRSIFVSNPFDRRGIMHAPTIRKAMKQSNAKLLS